MLFILYTYNGEREGKKLFNAVEFVYNWIDACNMHKQKLKLIPYILSAYVSAGKWFGLKPSTTFISFGLCVYVCELTHLNREQM